MYEGKKRRLLLVDDQEPVRLALTRAFERAGWSVRACGDGESAIDSLDRETYDAALVDNNLPGMSGNDVVRRIRLPGDDTPVVRISNSPAEKNLELKDLGISAYLVKPVDPRLVVQVVTEIVDRKKGLPERTTLGRVKTVPPPAPVAAPPPEEPVAVARSTVRPRTYVSDFLERRKTLDEQHFLAAHSDPVIVLEPSSEESGETLLPEAQAALASPPKSPATTFANERARRRAKFDTMPAMLTAELHERLRRIAARSEVLLVRKRAANLYGTKITIGRAVNNDLVIPHPSLAPFHAFARWLEDHTLVLVDAGVSGGTTVDWKPLPAGQAVVLSDGMELCFGQVRGRYYDAIGFWTYLGTFLVPGLKRS